LSYANPAFSSPDYCFYTGNTWCISTNIIPIFAVPIDRLVAPEPLNTLAKDPFAQVNSVSQLSDVKPTDWAFQALQSLVERYGCIAGYPDGTYRGNRATGRYEFAAGLNSCPGRKNPVS
jgi:glycosyltransferase involved in cell wall biosynthesis